MGRCGYAASNSIIALCHSARQRADGLWVAPRPEVLAQRDHLGPVKQADGSHYCKACDGPVRVVDTPDCFASAHCNPEAHGRYYDKLEGLDHG